MKMLLAALLIAPVMSFANHGKGEQCKLIPGPKTTAGQMNDLIFDADQYLTERQKEIDYFYREEMAKYNCDTCSTQWNELVAARNQEWANSINEWKNFLRVGCESIGCTVVCR